MTTTEFFERLEATPRKWFLDGSKIRIPSIELCTEPCAESLTCPGNAACGEVGVTGVMFNGMESGLPPNFVDQVVYSADQKAGMYRDLLLKACGL